MLFPPENAYPPQGLSCVSGPSLLMFPDVPALSQDAGGGSILRLGALLHSQFLEKPQNLGNDSRASQNMRFDPASVICMGNCILLCTYQCAKVVTRADLAFSQSISCSRK